MPTIKKLVKSPVDFGPVGLPTAPVPSADSPDTIRTLIIAPPGWGKTEFFMSNPEALLLACEEGHKFVSGYKIIIDAWDGTDPWTDQDGIHHMSFINAIALLQKEKKRFKLVVIDTVDALVKLCLDFHTGKKKVEHASDYGDYGKGWDVLQNTPFRRELNKIIKTGRGIGATTHQDVANKQFKSGTRAKKETTLPTGIYKILYAQFDLLLHGRFGKVKVKGTKKRDRILQSEGSEEVLAKNRGGKVPPAWIIPIEMKKRWAQFQSFFTNPALQDRAYEEFLKAGYELE